MVSEILFPSHCILSRYILYAGPSHMIPILCPIYPIYPVVSYRCNSVVAFISFFLSFLSSPICIDVYQYTSEKTTQSNALSCVLSLYIGDTLSVESLHVGETLSMSLLYPMYQITQYSCRNKTSIISGSQRFNVPQTCMVRQFAVFFHVCMIAQKYDRSVVYCVEWPESRFPL